MKLTLKEYNNDKLNIVLSINIMIMKYIYFVEYLLE